MSDGVAVWYFDGVTTRRQAAVLTVVDGTATLSGAVQRSCPISDLQVAERTTHGARKIYLPDGAYLEAQDRAATQALLVATGYRDSRLVRLQQSWVGVLLVLTVSLLLAALAYQRGLPWLADALAHAMPAGLERSLGEQALATLDARVLAPSRLPAATRRRITARVAALLPAQVDGLPVVLVFRSSALGPNAFALPSGQIVLIDSLVEQLGVGDGLLGVIGHEWGHLQHHHLLRRTLHDGLVGLAAGWLIGDVSGLAVTLTTVLIDQRYSRSAETEADDVAVALLRRHGLNVEAYAQVFEQLQVAAGQPAVPYLASHPSNAARVARIRARAADDMR